MSDNSVQPVHILKILKQGGSVEAVRAILPFEDRQRSTTLHLAIQDHCSLSILRTLISAGASLCTKDRFGSTPLMDAILECTDFEIFQLLVEADSRCVNILDSNENSPLIHALRMEPSRQNVILYLLASGADIKIRTNTNETPLHLATIYRHDASIIRRLISSGCDVEAKNDDGRTALHYAAYKHRSVKVFRELLRHNRYLVQMHDKHGDTALHFAVMENVSLDVLQILMKFGADPIAQNDDGNTSLHIAVMKHSAPEIFKELFRTNKHIPLDLPNKAGVPILSYEACVDGTFEHLLKYTTLKNVASGLSGLYNRQLQDYQNEVRRMMEIEIADNTSLYDITLHHYLKPWNVHDGPEWIGKGKILYQFMRNTYISLYLREVNEVYVAIMHNEAYNIRLSTGTVTLDLNSSWRVYEFLGELDLVHVALAFLNIPLR